MKKIQILGAALFTLSLITTSCEKFLEKEPIGSIGKEILFEDVAGAQLGLNGSYNLMLKYYKAEFGMYADISSDNVISIAGLNNVMTSQFDFRSTADDETTAPGHIWQSIYETLNNVNNVINAIPALQTAFPRQSYDLESIHAQALAIRAICHFDLCRTYAQPYNYTADASHPGIPVLLKTPEPGSEVVRASVKDTYSQIIADLEQSLSLFGERKSSGQATIGSEAVKALLSRVYLYQENWAKSAEYATELINSNTFRLAEASEYLKTFTTYPGNSSPAVEVLFQLSAEGLPYTSAEQNIYSVYSDTTAGMYHASNKLQKLFDDADVRGTMMFTRKVKGANQNALFTKKYGNATVSEDSDLSVKVIRLSEVYLNRAEANWHLGKYAEAVQDVQTVSQRAHTTPVSIDPATAPATLYKLIADERNRELCFEGHRLFDLNRRKEALTRGSDCNSIICALPYPNNKFILPITRKELDANKAMVQNPGYN